MTAHQHDPARPSPAGNGIVVNGKEMTMDARIDYLSNPLALQLVKHINSAWAVLHDSALPAATQELVKIRASQINGCGFCTDMHIKEALHAGKASSG